VFKRISASGLDANEAFACGTLDIAQGRATPLPMLEAQRAKLPAATRQNRHFAHPHDLSHPVSHLENSDAGTKSSCPGVRSAVLNE
jgi:hypothetical protein